MISLLISLSTFPLELYRLELFSITFDRFFLIISLMATAFDLILNNRKIRTDLLVLMLLSFVGILLAFPGIFFNSLVKPNVMIINIINILYFFLIVHHLSDPALTNSILKPLQSLLIILVTFGIYTIYVILTTGLPPLDIPFREFLPVSMGDAGHIIDAMRFRLGELYRFTVPFTRPQEFGFLAGLILFLLIYFRNEVKLTKSKFRAGTISCATLLLFSGSRSAIFPALASYIFYKTFRIAGYRISKAKVYMFLLLFVCAGLSTIIILDYVNINLDFINTFARITQDRESLSMHINIRILTLHYILNSSLSNALFGYGIGSFFQIFGVTSGHMSLGTLLIERGFIGVFIYLSFFAYISAKCGIQIIRSWIDVKNNYNAVLIFAIVQYIFLVNILYEVYYSRINWIALGIIFAIANAREHATIK